MVEPFSAVLVTLSTTAVRDLVAGKPPGRDSWASLAGELLRDVLEGQATTNDALARMDAKLDQLLVQDYQRSMRAALHLLEEAAPEWREPDERRRLIAEARDRLVDAVAASPGDYLRAIAE